MLSDCCCGAWKAAPPSRQAPLQRDAMTEALQLQRSLERYASQLQHIGAAV